MKSFRSMKFPIRLALLVAGLSTLFPLSTVSAAPEEPATSSGSDPIEVVVTAGRGLEQNPVEVPQSITAVGRETLEENSYVDIDDAIRSIPGVSLAPSEGNPNYWQEGFTLRGLGAQRVLTLTDGIRQAGQGIGYGGGNLSLYDPYNVEKIEVLRGPASVLYGTDAFGGVINITTREPERRSEFGTSQGFRYVFDGEADAHRYGAYLDVGDKDYSSVLSAGWGYFDRPNLPDDEEASQGSFREFSLNGKFDYFLSSESKVRIIGNMDASRDVLIEDSIIPLPIATFPPPGNSEMIASPLYFTFPRYQRSVVGAEYVYTPSGSAWDEIKTGVYWQQLWRQFHRETAFYPTSSPGFAGPPLFVDPSATVTQSVVDTNDRMNTVEWQTLARYVVDDHTFTFGFDFGIDDSYLPETEQQTVVGQAGLGAVTRPSSDYIDRVRADARQYRFGLYGQDTISLSSWEFVPGIRVDYHSVEEDQSNFDDDLYGVSGSLGTVYKLDEDNSVYLNLAHGYRAPDLGERFQNGIVNLGAPTRIIGKADLDAERSWSIELGTKNHRDRFTYDLAAFSTWVEDYITTQSLGFMNGEVVDQFDNVGTVFLYGAEAAANYAATDRWNVFANAARTFTPDDELIDVANWAFNYGTSYSIPVQSEWISVIRPVLQARTVLNSDQHTERPGRTEFTAGSFTVVDLLLTIDIPKAALGSRSTAKLIGGVRNLFDRNYQEPFFPEPQPGINGYVGVQFDF